MTNHSPLLDKLISTGAQRSRHLSLIKRAVVTCLLIRQKTEQEASLLKQKTQPHNP